MAVGEIVKVTNGEHLPADLISLSSRLEPLSRTGCVYVDPHPTPERSYTQRWLWVLSLPLKHKIFYTSWWWTFHRSFKGLLRKRADSAPIVINRSPWSMPVNVDFSFLCIINIYSYLTTCLNTKAYFNSSPGYCI